MNYESDSDLFVDELVESGESHGDRELHHSTVVAAVVHDPTSNTNDEFVHHSRQERSSKNIDTLNHPPRKKRHGARNQHKMKYFVQWIHETFLLNSNSDSNRVTAMYPTTAIESKSPSSSISTKNHDYILDVAGGKGELAARLVMCGHHCNNIHVTMVDPRPADIATVYHNWIVPKLPKKWQEQYYGKYEQNNEFVHDILKERFVQLQMYFTTETVNGSTGDGTLRDAIERCTLMIGMHADSATECIVDMALQYQKPFVVVPCCVFPNLFTQRFLSVVVSDNTTATTGTTTTASNTDHDNCKPVVPTTIKVPVRTYEQFCDYLHQKDERFQRTVLPFDGRNVAIWWDGK
jgi:hypothetical protein